MLYQELKKIFRPGVILAALVLGAVYYWMYLDFYVNYYPTNYGVTIGPKLLEVTGGWVDTYGPSLERDEVEEIENTLPALYGEADGYLAAYPVAQEHGIASYEDYLAFSEEVNLRLFGGGTGNGPAVDDPDYQDLWRINDYLSGPETDNVSGRMYAVGFLHMRYDRIPEPGTLGELSTEVDMGGLSKKEHAHVLDAFFGPDEAWRNILPVEVMEGTGVSAFETAIWTVLCLCLLLGPALTRDRMNRMLALQYASRRGRAVSRTQLGTYLITAFAIATVNTALFAVFFLKKHGLGAFFSCRMYSFLHPFFSWPNWTFGTWCVVLGLIHYALAFTTAGLIFLLSRCSGNYISMLLKVIPLFAVFAFFIPRLMEYAFYFRNDLYTLTGVPYIEAIIPVVLLALSSGLCMVFIRRLQRRDVLTA